MISFINPRVKKPLVVLFWTVVILFSGYFYYGDAIAYFFGYRSPRFGETFFQNQFWFVAHIAGATCSLFLGPVQFWKVIRINYVGFHRLAGKIYIIGSLVAAVCALRLALIFDCIGCRYSLIPLSVLFFVTTSLAWYAIQQKKIVAHKQFMVRSYVCALAFVFVRLYQILPLDFIFRPIVSDDVFAVVLEWTFSILPLMLVEIFMIWIPSLQNKNTAV